ncbi:MAG TPA: universal stress protein [Actinomycetota bacterium]|nr:universal stress protein [Actinomycetota bacterium]
MKVLFATDGFQPSLDALTALQRWLDPKDLSMTVLSVAPIASFSPEDLLVELDPKAVRTEAARELAGSTVTQLEKAGFTATMQVEAGHPGREIVRAASEGGHDLAVIGGGGTSWMKRHLLGSVSNYVVHSAPTPVLVVHEVSDREAVRILLAVDGSDHSDAAVDLVCRLVDPQRCSLAIASVVPLTEPVVVGVAGSVAVIPIGEERSGHAVAAAERAVEAAAERARKAGFEVEERILEGAPGPTIVGEARIGIFDLVALGARGHGRLHSLILGSVSDTVVRHCPATLIAR